MKSAKKILFIQLPYVDNHIGGHNENQKLAAVYLQYAMERAGEDRYFKTSICPADVDEMDDRHLVDFIVKNECPSVIAVTLYLWNIERTLHVLREVKKKLPSVYILAGGPEIAPDHPFLFRSFTPNAVAVGEGEQVFPSMLKSLRTGERTDFTTVAWKYGPEYVWGKSAAKQTNLINLLPPSEYKSNKPDANGIAYVETSRGCPLKCAFCCYNQKRNGVSFILADDVVNRVSLLIGRGAREVRFVDPTFNSNPDFERILEGLIKLNSGKKIRCFAELRAETVTRKQADLLKKANFREIEVGVQSRDKIVLKAIKRPTRLSALDRGIRFMSERGIKLTVDIMCGLPFQGLADIGKSLKWAFGIKNAYIQFLHTLLIPGTDLRNKCRQLGLQGQQRPPYRVISTNWMSSNDMKMAEKIAFTHAGRLMDSPAVRFAGKDLPDLYDEKIHINISKRIPVIIPGRTNRRAVIIKGNDLYGKRQAVCNVIRMAITTEPHTLWQFVLAPVGEEPLDLLDSMIVAIDKHQTHLLDNMAVIPDGYHRIARRVFVLLCPEYKYSRSWIGAVNDLLSANFY
ncbi:MAG: B12-binding domain-containing radical SAM protein [Kiritimatiellae bacterium]|nr:B12-binding domain-containing radical SAM protein [Kiritimatiellia bacterium]MDD5523186.1 B12-binding domain-containing radical SAM protein [Kiritimatiellia bacterium]